MKKELKNQLKAYGFQKEVNHYYKIIGDYRFSLGCELVDLEVTEIISGKVHSFGFIKTFARIALAIQELTGVTLTLTKRQEIDTLRESVKMLDEEVHGLGIFVAKNKKENQELGKRIDVLEEDKTFRAIEGIEDLMDQAILAQLAFPKGGVSSATVHGGETILGKNIANTTKEEPNSEPEKTEGVFKVGDLVVLNPVIDFSINSIKLEAAAQTVFTVSGTNTNCFYLSKNGKPFFKDILFYQCELLNAPIKRIFETGNRVVVKPRNTYTFLSSDSKRNKAKCSTILIIQDICGNNSVAGGLEIETNDGRYTVGELQHAPKEAAKVLEFGDMLESLVENDGVKIGQKVVFLSKSAKKHKEDVPEGLKEYHVIDEWTNHYSMTADSFKGFEPKEKVLEFGGWAETLTDGIYIKKGSKVLLCNVRVDDSYCYDEKGNNNWVENDNLKAL